MANITHFIPLLVLLHLIFFGIVGIIYQSSIGSNPEDLKGTYIKWNNRNTEPIVYCHSNGTCTYSTHRTPSDSTDDVVSTAAPFYLTIFYFWIGLVLSIPFLLIAIQLEKRKIKILSPFLDFSIRTVYFGLRNLVKVVDCFILLVVLTCAYFALLFTIYYLIHGALGEPSFNSTPPLH